MVSSAGSSIASLVHPSASCANGVPAQTASVSMGARDAPRGFATTARILRGATNAARV